MPSANLHLSAMPADASPTAAAAGPAKDAVLLVDDEQSLLEVFVAALAPDFEVTTVNSTREAEFALRKKAFKVVVADHLMPGGNGMSLLVRAREEYPHMQRVLVTGYMKPEMLLRSVNEAALFRYLLKPVAIAELIKVVRDAAKAHDLSVAAAR
jgi:DNA-binding NtrC family response regulator